MTKRRVVLALPVGDAGFFYARLWDGERMWYFPYRKWLRDHDGNTDTLRGLRREGFALYDWGPA